MGLFKKVVGGLTSGYKKIKNQATRTWKNYKGTILGAATGGIAGAGIGGMMDYENHEMEKLAQRQQAELDRMNAAAERERNKTTITDENSVGGDTGKSKKKKRSILAGADRGNASGTLLGGGYAGERKLGD